MTFRIDRSIPVAKELPRLAGEELEGAAADLRGAADDRAKAIHEARKKLKKTRAVLRLVRPHLGERFRADKGWIRDAAARMSGARDADVLVETARALREGESSPALDELERRLEDRAARIRQSAEAPDLEAIAERVREAGDRVSSWPELPNDFAAIRAGVERIYRKGRRARDLAAADRTNAEAMHEWRKRAKDLWYATRLLADLDPVVAAQESNLDVLCERLGDRHDLDVLEATLEREPGLLEGLSREDVLRLIASHRNQLDDGAFLLGSVVYATGPRRFTETLEALWERAGEPARPGSILRGAKASIRKAARRASALRPRHSPSS